jgi:nicotinamidase-related amidase
MTEALIVVDVQTGFADPSWGPRDNPACEENVAALIAAYRRRGEPVVFVRHDSEEPDSTLRPDRPGNAFQEVVHGEPDLLVAKQVNSAFLGDPPLEPWLRERGVEGIAVCGITTNHCCETTARMGANLGFAVRFVLDATHTFDRVGPDGAVFPAELLARVTAANLHGEFAAVVRTAELV